MEESIKKNWIWNYVQRTGKSPKLHEYPKEFLSYKQIGQVESFLRRHPNILKEEAEAEKKWKGKKQDG